MVLLLVVEVVIPRVVLRRVPDVMPLIRSRIILQVGHVLRSMSTLEHGVCGGILLLSLPQQIFS